MINPSLFIYQAIRTHAYVPCRVPEGSPPGGQFASCNTYGWGEVPEGKFSDIEEWDDIESGHPINSKLGWYREVHDKMKEGWWDEEPMEGDDLELGEESNSLAVKYKKHVCDTLAQQLNEDPAQVSLLVKTWAESSNDHDYRSLSLQEVASKEFGVPLSEWQKNRIVELFSGKTDDPDIFVESLEHVERHAFGKSGSTTTAKALRTMYNNTQVEFKKAGVTHIDVYRGFLVEKDSKFGKLRQNQKVRIAGANTLESWSLSATIAHTFMEPHYPSDVGFMVRTRVPATRVLSMPSTGFGSLGEMEVVLLGGNGDRVHIVSKDVK